MKTLNNFMIVLILSISTLMMSCNNEDNIANPPIDGIKQMKI